MSWVQYLLGNRENLLQMWKKNEIFAENNRVRAEQPRRHSILGNVIKKNGSRGAKHGPSERQRKYHTFKQMLKKARRKKHGNHPTILSRWYASESYRDSLSEFEWKEKDTMPYDRISLEKHVYVSTKAERTENSKHWILTLNAEGPQQPLNQRPDFAQAKRECKRLHDQHLARTQQDCRTIPRSQQVRQRKEQQFERIEEFDFAVDPKTGWMFYKESRWNTSSWNSQHSSRSDDLWIFLRVRTSFGCLEKNIQSTDGEVKQYTHKYSTCRVAQHDHISSREHA